MDKAISVILLEFSSVEDYTSNTFTKYTAKLSNRRMKTVILEITLWKSNTDNQLHLA